MRTYDRATSVMRSERNRASLLRRISVIASLDPVGAVRTGSSPLRR